MSFFLPALLVGAIIMWARNAPLSYWAGHLLVTAIGSLCYLIVVAVPHKRVERSALPALLTLVLVALLTPVSNVGMIAPGALMSQLHVNPSALLCPTAIVLAAMLASGQPTASQAALVGLQGLNVFLADAAQASALAVAAGALALMRREGGRSVWLFIHSLAVFAAWARFEPRPPTAFVEDIAIHAFMLGPVAACVALASLVLAVCAPLTELTKRGKAPPARIGLFLYFVSTVLVSIFGEFPVPWLGFSPSPILGAFIGLGLAALPKPSCDTTNHLVG